jgi:hypothetical protein
VLSGRLRAGQVGLPLPPVELSGSMAPVATGPMDYLVALAWTPGKYLASLSSIMEFERLGAWRADPG